MKRHQIALAAIVVTLLTACGQDDAAPTPAAPAAPTATSAPLTAATMPSTPTEQPAMVAAEMEECPTLQITSPMDGDTVNVPVEVHYEIGDVAAGSEAPLFVRVSIVGLAEVAPFEVAVEGTSGVLTIPDNKLMTGVRDVRFQLLDADHEPYPSAKSEVTVHQLLIAGGR